MNRSTLFAGLVFVSMVSVLVVSNVAAAGGTPDPRKCAYGPTRKADCVRDAATLVARRLLARKTGTSYLWQGPLTCTATGSMLRYRCVFTSSFKQLPARGFVAVTYRATRTGWHVYASVAAAP